jgi:hypothetical protein
VSEESETVVNVGLVGRDGQGGLKNLAEKGLRFSA